MSFQRGSLKRLINKNGADRWVLRYRTTAADGRRVENTLNIGLLRDFPRERDAWREAERLTLLAKINEEQPSSRLNFAGLAAHYLKAEFGPDAMRSKTEDTTLNMQHICDDYLIPRFGSVVAADIKPLEIQRWLKMLHDEKGLAWSTVSKIRGVMSRAYKTGILHQLVAVNPVLAVETRSKTTYRAIVLRPDQTLQILGRLVNPIHRMLVLTAAATALRSSELLSLRWADLWWTENRIRVSKRWARGKDGDTKTEASDGFVPMHPALAQQLRNWQASSPYASETDFVFPSLKADGKVPVSGSIFVADHLRPAAIASGVEIRKSQRFGLHNLRHSLSHWLVTTAKVDPKTVQGILRHSRIQTTLDLYTQENSDQTRGAQGRFLEAMGMATATIQ
jgi:integrase